MTPVIFRKYKDGDIIAIFPMELGSNKPDTCGSYMQVGQHGACDPRHVVQGTTLATPEEYKPLHDELVNIVGYDDLNLIKRIPATAFQARKDKLLPRASEQEKATPQRDATSQQGNLNG